MTSDEKRIYERALTTFGSASQIHKCSEEMSELNKVLMKYLCDGMAGNRRDELVDELADVKITCEQMEYMFALIPDVKKRKEEKLARLVSLLDVLEGLEKKPDSTGQTDSVDRRDADIESENTYDVRVKILKCSNPNWWYSNMVGEVFEARKSSYGDYTCDLPDDSIGFITKTDCVEMAQ